MAIYTKTGDKGETKVFDKNTGKLVGVSKKSCKIKAIGAIDELNSWLGVVRSNVGSPSTSLRTSEKWEVRKIREIQENLFIINSIIAGSNLRFSKSKIKKLEREIDEWEGGLPVLKNFIYYSGSPVASRIFYARALCRRAERSLVSFFRRQPTTNFQLLEYINRLSDYLFMLARKINFEEKVKEEYWVGSRKR